MKEAATRDREAFRESLLSAGFREDRKSDTEGSFIGTGQVHFWVTARYCVTATYDGETVTSTDVKYGLTGP